MTKRNGKTTATTGRNRHLTLGAADTTPKTPRGFVGNPEHRPQMLPRLLERFVLQVTPISLDKLRLEALQDWAAHRYFLLQVITGVVPAKVADRLRALDQLRVVGVPTKIEQVPFDGDLGRFDDHELDRIAHGEDPQLILAERNGGHGA